MVINIRPATKLYLLVFVMSVFILGVGIFGVIGMRKMSRNTETMYADRMLPLQELTQIRYSYTTGIRIVAEALENHTLTPVMANTKIELAQRIIEQNWQAYLQTYLTPEETQLVKQTSLLKEQADKAISDLNQKIQDLESGVPDKIGKENIYAAIDPVVTNINRLAQLQIRVSDELYEANDQLYSSTEKKLFLLIFISLLIAAVLGVLIIGDTRKFIKELKFSHRKIKESEEQYRHLFQNSPACTIIWDIENMCVLEVNDIVIEKYGYDKEEWANMPVTRYRPEEDHENIRAFAQKMLRSNEPPPAAVWTHLKKNGEEMQMEIYSHQIVYKGHKAILSLATDITEKTKAKADLQKSETNFRSLVDHAADAIFMVTDAGVIFDVNKSASRLLFYTKEELIGKSVLELHPKEVRQHVPEIWDVLRKKKSLVDERGLLRKDGTIVEVEISRQMLPDASGAISIVRDITERKFVEEKIRQSEANYRQLFDLSPAPMWVIDDETARFVQVNKACIDNYGYSEEEFSGMTIADIYPGDALADDSHQNAAFMRGKRYQKKSGELMDIEVSSIPLMSNGEKKILMIAIDVTEKNLYEQKLAKAAIKAQEEERYEIGGELHDNICQILATSQIFLGMIRKTLPPASEELYDSTLRYIILASDEIRNLSHRLAPAFFDDASLGDAFHQLLMSFNTEKKYEVSLNFDKQLQGYPLHRDLQLNLYRILQEQLRNISKHAKATKIKVSVTITDQVLQMKVEDNGVGFDAKSGKGGIGLANMNRRVQLFSGNFAIDSSAGNGCEIRARVPV